MPKKTVIMLGAACLLCLGLFTAPAMAPAKSKPAAASPATVMFVLDASGSMWGQVKGKAKIQIAKEVMAKLVDGLPGDIRVGLSAYGHRRKGDCDDIETLIKPGSLNRAAIKAKVNAINPKGKTPLSEAVRRVAKELRYTEEKATVVLVSDGLETCHADPCALAEELAKAGVDFTVHVIGFAISKDEQEQLRCLADRTGGLFLSADDADGLLAALKKTVAKVKEPPKPVKVDPGKATLQGPDQVPVGQAFEVKWDGPDSKGDLVALAPKKPEDASWVTYAYTKSGNPVRLRAPGDAGDYELRYIHGHTRKVIGRAQIKVTPVSATLQAPAKAQVAAKIQVEWTGPAYKGDYISIAKPDQRPGSYQSYAYTSQGSPLKLQVPAEPGPYEVRYILGAGHKVITKIDLEVTPATAQVKAPPETKAASKFRVDWQGPGYSSDYISVARPDQNPAAYVYYTRTREGNPVVLKAPSEPGEYEVRYIQGYGHKLLAKTTIKVKAVGAAVKAPESAAAASKFKVNWQGPGYSSDYISVARPDQNPAAYVYYTRTREGNPVVLKAPSEPGQYEVRYILAQGHKLLAKTEIEIKPVTAAVKAPESAAAASKFKVNWQGPGYKSDYISVARPDQNPAAYVYYTRTREGNPVEIKAPSEPGKYEVRYILAQGHKLLAKTTIEIEPVTAAVKAPESAEVASKFKVNWQGPGYKSDYISVARPDQRPASHVKYAHTRDGNPVVLKAPSEPGKYEVRYILAQGHKLLAKTTIEIKPVTAVVKAPESAAMGSKIKVNWQGPGYKPDYISIARLDQRPGSYVHYTYTREGNPALLKTPSKPGKYEVRYILGQGHKLLAKTVIEIKPVSASLQAPAEVKAGEQFQVKWQGPGNQGDYISIARPDQRSGSYVEMAWTADGNPLKIKAPKKAGQYELRYILGQGDKLLAKQPLDVK